MDSNNEIRIYSDVYSQLLEKVTPEEWWDKNRPIIVQTAACGLPGRIDKEAPYFRKITVNGGGLIVGFQVMNRDGIVQFGERNEQADNLASYISED